MKKNLKYYRSLPYTRRSQPIRDKGGNYWLAWIEELEGCKTDGDTETEAFAKLEEVFDDYIEAKLGWKVSIIVEPSKQPVKGRGAKKSSDIRVEIASPERLGTFNVTSQSLPETEPETSSSLVPA